MIRIFQSQFADFSRSVKISGKTIRAIYDKNTREVQILSSDGPLNIGDDFVMDGAKCGVIAEVREQNGASVARLAG